MDMCPSSERRLQHHTTTTTQRRVRSGRRISYFLQKYMPCFIEIHTNLQRQQRMLRSSRLLVQFSICYVFSTVCGRFTKIKIEKCSAHNSAPDSVICFLF